MVPADRRALGAARSKQPRGAQYRRTAKLRPDVLYTGPPPGGVATVCHDTKRNGEPCGPPFPGAGRKWDETLPALRCSSGSYPRAYLTTGTFCTIGSLATTVSRA